VIISSKKDDEDEKKSNPFIDNNPSEQDIKKQKDGKREVKGKQGSIEMFFQVPSKNQKRNFSQLKKEVLSAELIEEVLKEDAKLVNGKEEKKPNSTKRIRKNSYVSNYSKYIPKTQ